MRKVKLVVIFLLPIVIFAGEYSVITESSPWGIVAVWDDADTPHLWREKYMPKIDSSLSCGLSWNRPNCIPHNYKLQNDDRTFDFAQIDSFVRFMQEHGPDILMNTLYVGWPRNFYPEFDDDTIGYSEFYRTLVERYDGDGEGYTVPPEWGGITYAEPEWLKKPIKCWEICNEPYGDRWWPKYNYRTLEDFRTYVRAASRGIHDADPDAKVVGPAIKPLHDCWKHKLSKRGEVWVDSVCCFDTSGVNIIKNYGFEDSLDYWHIWTNTSPSWSVVSCDFAFQGTLCLYSDSTIDTLFDTTYIKVQYPKLSQDIPKISDVLSDTDTAFSVSCYVKTDSLIGALYLQIRVVDSNYIDTMHYMSPCITGTNGWCKLENVIKRSELSDSAWIFYVYIARTLGRYYNMKPAQLWQEIIGDSCFFDVISVHEYSDEDSTVEADTIVDHLFNDLERCKDILTDLGVGDKPIWMTETGWQNTEGSINTHHPVYPEPLRAEIYNKYAEEMVSRDCLDKTFFFVMKERSSWAFNLLDDDWMPYASYTTLQNFISRNTPHINLVSPEGGDTLFSGVPYTITYDSVSDNNTPSGNILIKIEYSTDGGWNYNVIADSLPNTGSYEWTPPHLPSDSCRVRVFAQDEHGLEGLSYNYGYFSIVDTISPSVNLITPGNYKVVYEGQDCFCLWQSSDEGGIDSQTLYYGDDSLLLGGGEFFTYVEPQVSGRGDEQQFRLEATDSSGNTGEDANTVVVVDSNQTNYTLSWTHNDNWNVTIFTFARGSKVGKVCAPLTQKEEVKFMPDPNPFNRVYKGFSNNWERINLGEISIWTDPDPLSEGEFRRYLVCLNDFDSVSNRLEVHRPDFHPCPILYTFTGDSFELDNSLLPRSEYIQESYMDRYILRKCPDSKDRYRFMIQDDVDTAYIDVVRLYVVDHPDSVEVGVTNEGKLVPYTVSALPVSVYDCKGMEWMSVQNFLDEGYIKEMKGGVDTLFVEFDGQGGDYVKTKTSIREKPKPIIGISGSTIYTRLTEDEILSSKEGKVTYTFPDIPVKLESISLVKGLSNKNIVKKRAAVDNMPRLLRYKDGNYLKVVPGDIVKFSFSKLKGGPVKGWKRDYMIEVFGSYTAGDKIVQGDQGQGAEVFRNDMRFIRTLGRKVEIEFESASERKIDVKVFDVVGRSVKREVLKLSPGIQRYSVEGLPSGIYFIWTSGDKDRLHKVTVIR